MSVVLSIAVRGMMERRVRHRGVLLALGSTLAVFLSLSIAAQPAVRSHEAARSNMSILIDQGSSSGLGFREAFQDFHGRRLVLRQVSKIGGGPAPKLVGGVTDVPDPGEMLVSPALHEALKDSTLSAWLPYRLVGVLPPELVGGAGRLVALIGVTDAPALTPATTADGRPFVDSFPRWGSSWGRAGLLGATLLVAVPTAGLLWVASRLGAAMRTQRSTALRMLGLSRQATTAIAAIEALVPAMTGSLLGWYGFDLIAHRANRVPFVNRWYYPQDVTRYGPVTVGVIALVTLAAAGFNAAPAWRSNRLARSTRFSLAHRVTSRWLLAVPAVSVVALLAALVRARPGDPLLTIGIVAFGLGLPSLLVFTVQRIAAAGSRIVPTVTGLLAVRRLEAHPTRAVRIAGVAAIAVYAVCAIQPWSQVFTSGHRRSWIEGAINQRGDALLGTATGDGRQPVTSATLDSLRSISGVQVVAPVVGIWDRETATAGRPHEALIATCDQLRRIYNRPFPDCLDEPKIINRRITRAAGQSAPPNPNLPVKTQQVRTPAGVPLFDITPPTMQLNLDPTERIIDPSSSLRSAWLLSPGDARLRTVDQAWFTGAAILMTADEPTWDRVQAAVVAINPNLTLKNPYTQHQNISTVGLWATLGVVLSASMVLLCGLVTAIEAAHGHEREWGALRAIGAGRRSILAVKLAEGLIAGTIAVALAAFGALLSTTAYWRMQHDDPYPRLAPYAGVVIGGLTAISITTLIGSPTRIRRVTNRHS
jgi:hypothetical protein